MVLVLAVLNAAIVLAAPLLVTGCTNKCPIQVLSVAGAAVSLFCLLRIKHDRLRNIIEAVKSLILGSSIFYLIAFVFGSFIVQYLPTLLTIDDSRNAQQNLAWSFWMSSLTILPATLELGPLLTNKEQWKRVFQERRHRTPQEASLFYSILALLVGNWAACAIVPLDWNVPWQVWPIPNAMLGSVFYLIATLLVGCACCKAKYVPIVEVEARMGRKTSGKAAAKSKEETVKSEKKEMVKSEKETPASTPRRAAAAKKSPKRASRASSKSPAAKKKASPSRARSASKTKTPGWKVKSTAASRSPSRTPRRSSRKA